MQQFSFPPSLPLSAGSLVLTSSDKENVSFIPTYNITQIEKMLGWILHQPLWNIHISIHQLAGKANWCTNALCILLPTKASASGCQFTHNLAQTNRMIYNSSVAHGSRYNCKGLATDTQLSSPFSRNLDATKTGVQIFIHTLEMLFKCFTYEARK